MSYHGENALQHINQESFSLNSCRISGYFDTKFTAVGIIEPILHKFEDLKIINFLNPEQVYFLVAHVMCMHVHIHVVFAVHIPLKAKKSLTFGLLLRLSCQFSE